MNADLEVDVLIVGAGPVGLAAAIELGRRDVRCLVVERNDRVGYSPRAKTTNVRTREHLRRWGIAETLRAASPFSPDYPSDAVFATRMNGPLLTRFENALDGTARVTTSIRKAHNGCRNIYWRKSCASTPPRWRQRGWSSTSNFSRSNRPKRVLEPKCAISMTDQPVASPVDI